MFSPINNLKQYRIVEEFAALQSASQLHRQELSTKTTLIWGKGEALEQCWQGDDMSDQAEGELEAKVRAARAAVISVFAELLEREHYNKAIRMAKAWIEQLDAKAVAEPTDAVVRRVIERAMEAAQRGKTGRAVFR